MPFLHLDCAMNPTPPPLPGNHQKQTELLPVALRIFLRLAFLFVSFLPAAWLLVYQRMEDKFIGPALICTGMLCVICALVMFRGVFKSKLAYVLVSLALAACLFGVNLCVGLFLGCVNAFKN